MREKLVCDCRSGCVAIYPESRKDDTNGCHKDDARNIAYSDKDAKFNGSYWEMDEVTQNIFIDMVNAYNNCFNMKGSEMKVNQWLPDILDNPISILEECGFFISIEGDNFEIESTGDNDCCRSLIRIPLDTIKKFIAKHEELIRFKTKEVK